MPAPQAILDLVERFDLHRDSYLSSNYNETQVRREFIDPMFKALGWDVDNEKGFSEQWKEVVHEDAIKVGAATKVPDYSFRLGGRRLFFLEAKKPSINLKEDPSPAYQLRRYGWTAKLPLSILTDFEEFIVYDTRVRPAAGDKASKARILYIRYDEYPERWDEIVSIFSPRAIQEGAFDKYVQSATKKRGTAEVDQAFLAEIEEWRELLARNIAIRNSGLSQRELNFAVQRIIDRIIFLRICEDRGVEDYGRLQTLLNGVNVYPRLRQIFERADERYNSGLFHFYKEKGRPDAPDLLTPQLKIDDKAIKAIISRLYYPESPYEFSVMPAETLGHIYERFLGSVIRLTPGHRAIIEEKPEVRKAGGVYYTPTYIVDYIVKNTVGKLLEDKKPGPRGGVSKLRVLDPACGSGSFLLGAYQYLLNWHQEQYAQDPDRWTKGSNPAIFQDRRGEWRLTTAERKRILINNIYGVDIDPQAVEVTKLSLLLKVLEGENAETLGRQLKLFHERALPDLGNNIKCGNSLIGPDYYEGRQMDLFNEDEMIRINAFDWTTEFPEIMGDGGFDAVIGNPPWGQKAIHADASVKKYLREKYPSIQGIYDYFRPFVEKGILTTKQDGYFGMVLPDIILLKDYPQTRSFILEEIRLSCIDWWGMAFRTAVIDATTIIGRRGKVVGDHIIQVAAHDQENPYSGTLKHIDLLENPRHVFNIYLTPERRKIWEHLKKYHHLGEYFEIHEGVHSGNIRSELFVDQRIDNTCRELLFGRDEIAPFNLQWRGRYIRLGALPEKKTRKRYANLGHSEWHTSQKVLVRRTGDYVLAAVDEKGRYASNNLFLVLPKEDCPLDLDGVCALLNSRFMTWYFRLIEPRKGRVFAELKIKHLSVFPLPFMDDYSDWCGHLNALGKKAREIANLARQEDVSHVMKALNRSAIQTADQIENAVCRAFKLTPIDLDCYEKEQGHTPITKFD